MSKLESKRCCQSIENHVRMHRAFRSCLPALLLALIISSLVFFLSHFFGIFGAELEFAIGDTSYNLTLPLFLLFSLVLIARPLLLLLDCHHDIKCHHLLSVNGIFSINKEQVEIPFEDIMGVRISQSLLDRLLNIGTILAWTAVADRPEIVMHGIGNPQYFAKLIQNKIDESLIARRPKPAIS